MADQRKAIERMSALAQKALLMKEDDIAAALFNTYNKSLNRIIHDLVGLNSDFLSKDKGRTLSTWRSLKLDIESTRMIADHMTGLNKLVAMDLLDKLGEHYKDAYSYTAWVLDQTTPPNIESKWNLPDDSYIKQFIAAPWKGQMFSDRLWVRNDEMARQLQKSLVDGIMSGDSSQDIARAMRENVGVPADTKLVTRPRASAQVYRALMIARTEAMRATSIARKKVWEENSHNLFERKWSAAPGFVRVCDECADRDEMTESEIKKEYGAGNSEPPLHPNCRCIYTIVPKSWGKLARPLWAGSDLGPIDEYSMQHPDATGTKLVSMKAVPYDQWLEED
jgi:hypothetical protein